MKSANKIRLTAAALSNLSLVGSVLILCVGINLIWKNTIRVANLLPAIVLVKDMDRRGKIVNAAYIVCAASAFAAHLGFTAGVDPTMIAPLLVTKLLGGALGAAIALMATKKNA